MTHRIAPIPGDGIGIPVTEAALRVMMESGVREGIVAGCKAAEARGKELGKILGEG